MRELLDRYGGNQTRLAPDLDVEQPTISAFLSSKRQGTSLHVVQRMAELLGRDVRDVLGIPRSPAEAKLDDGDPKPNRARAIHAAQLLGLEEDDVADVRRQSPPGDPLPLWWFRQIWHQHEARVTKMNPTVADLPPPPRRGRIQEQGRQKKKAAG